MPTSLIRIAPLLALVVLAMPSHLPARADNADDIIDTQAILHRLDQVELTPDDVARIEEELGKIKERAKDHLTPGQRIGRILLDPWVCFGFFAQFVFGMRFVWQLIVSERKKRSHVPVAFWYLSLIGGLMLFSYALFYRYDPVFVAGQGLGVFIYARNLMLIYSRKNKLDELRNERKADAAVAENGLDEI